MDLIGCISKVLKISRDEVIENSKSLGSGLTYYWSPVRGGLSLIVDEKGDYLAARSSVGLDNLLEEYKKGEKVKR